MSKSFVLVDKNNNLQKTATSVVKFIFEGKDYLIYSVDENENNSQIFVSRIILNSEGKYFIDNIMPEEKGKLNNIVYNIVILVPTEAQKGSTFNALTGNLLEKFSVKLSSGLPEIDVQEYYSNCSVAITSKVLVDAAIKLYDDNLNNVSTSEASMIPTWTSPVEATAPTPTAPIDGNVSDVQAVSSTSANIPVQESVVVSDLNSQSTPVSEPVLPVVEAPIEAVNSVSTTAAVNTSVSSGDVQLNPQTEKLVVVSDPSLGIGVYQPNVGKNKEAGFANTKYVVIGTVCLVLSVVVVVAAFLLINNIA